MSMNLEKHLWLKQIDKPVNYNFSMLSSVHLAKISRYIFVDKNVLVIVSRERHKNQLHRFSNKPGSTVVMFLPVDSFAYFAD